MTTGLTTSPTGYARVRRRARVFLFTTAALALAAIPFVAHPTIARADFDYNQYQWCLEHIGLGNDYCCQQAGGVVANGGQCVPSAAYVPAPTTVTQRPVIPALPGTVTSP